MAAMEKFYFEQSMKSCKQAGNMFDSVLSKVLTISSILVGGGLVLLDKLIMPNDWKVGMLSLFFVGVLFCLAGLFPTGGHVQRNPYTLRAMNERAVRRKKDNLVLACLSLTLGFSVGILGVYVQTISTA